MLSIVIEPKLSRIRLGDPKDILALGHGPGDLVSVLGLKGCITNLCTSAPSKPCRDCLQSSYQIIQKTTEIVLCIVVIY